MANRISGEIVIVLHDKHYLGCPGEWLVFSTQKHLLEYFQMLNPKAKHLRIKVNEYRGTHLQILNYNTPISSWYEIQELEIDRAR